MITRRYQVIVYRDPDDDVWVTHVPDLGDISTFGDTREEALEHTREAIAGYIEAAAKEGLPIPDARVSAELVALDVAVE
jgi:predicted RNase H-like HicB family nuclease